MNTPIHTPEQMIELLENAIDHNTMSEFYMGYTAKELHRKSLAVIKQLLEERNSYVGKPSYIF